MTESQVDEAIDYAARYPWDANTWVYAWLTLCSDETRHTGLFIVMLARMIDDACE